MGNEIDDGWEEITIKMNINAGPPTPCLGESQLEGFVHKMLRTSYFNNENEFVQVFRRYGSSIKDIEDKVYGHMRGCQRCRDAYEATKKSYETMRQSLAPK